MTEITVEEFQENIDQVIERVEDGEVFIIRSPSNQDYVIVPYDYYTSYCQEFFEHNDAC